MLCQLLTSGYLNYWLFQQIFHMDKPKIVLNFSDKPITDLYKLCLLDYLLKDYSKLKMV